MQSIAADYTRHPQLANASRLEMFIQYAYLSQHRNRVTRLAVSGTTIHRISQVTIG